MIEETSRSQVSETTIATQQQNLVKAFEILRKQGKMSHQMRPLNAQNLYSKHRRTKMLSFNPLDVPVDIRTERTMKAYWQLLDENYFRPLEEEDIQPIESILGKTKSYLIEKQMYDGDESFKEQINNILTQEYFARHTEEENIVNIKFINLFYSFETNPHLTLKQAEEKRKEARQAFSKFHMKQTKSLSHRGKEVNEHKKKSRLQEEFNLLQKLKQENRQDLDELSQQIAKLESELEIQNNKNKEQLLTLKQPTIEYCLDQNIALLQMPSLAMRGRTQQLVDRFYKIQETCSYMDYQIKQLEICQISDSIAKIKKLSPNEILVIFESAMNIPPKTFTAQQFQNLNKRRDYSLYAFYNAGVKCLFSYICHNFDGFKDLCDDIRKNAQNYKALVHKNALDLNEKEENIFDDLQMCHQCKYILPTANLTKCGYNSRQFSLPKFASCIYSPVVAKEMQGTRGQCERSKPYYQPECMKNSYIYYGIENGIHTCGRYFCKMCLDHYNKDNKNRETLCPFCLKICNCVRCLRNETITKMKTIFSYFGNIYELQQNSQFEKYYGIKQDSFKKKSISPESKEVERVKCYKLRLRMDDLRMISSMTKRREVVKAKTIELDKKIFREKLTFTPFWATIREQFEQIQITTTCKSE